MAADAPESPRLASSTRAAAGLVAIQLLSFVSMWVVSHAMGPGAYGRLGLALVAGVYAYQVVQAGLDTFQTRLLAQASSEEARKILGGTLRQKIFAALLALGAGGVLTLPWSAPNDSLFILLGVLDGVVLGFTLPSAFDARGATAQYLGFAIVRQSFYLAGVLLLTTVFPHLVTPWGVLLVHVGAIVPQILLERRWIRRHYGAADFSEAAQRSRVQLRAALPLSLGSAAWQISVILGPPVLAFTGHQDEMGYLVLSNQLAQGLQSVAMLSARLAGSRLAGIADPFGKTFAETWSRTMVLHTFGGAVFACAASIGGAYLIDTVWGSHFRGAVGLFLVDVWRVVGAFGGGVTSAALVCRSRLKTLAACHMAALLCAAAISLIGIPAYGARAAVWATVAARGSFLIFSALCLTSPVLHRREEST